MTTDRTFFRIDAKGLGEVAAAIDDLSESIRTRVVVRALNRVGGQAYTKAVRVVAEDTGAKIGRVRHVLKKRPASAANGGAFAIVARDGFMTLKDFGPSQRAKGVSAAPWKTRRVFAGSFFGPGGHVYVRERGKTIIFSRGAKAGHKGNPIKKLWGPAIPRALMADAAEAELKKLIGEKLPARIVHEADFELGRIKSKRRL